MQKNFTLSKFLNYILKLSQLRSSSFVNHVHILHENFTFAAEALKFGSRRTGTTRVTLLVFRIS